MDWSAFFWFFSGVGATLVGVIAQYWVSTRLEDRRRQAEFYRSRLEKIEPWLAELDYALMDLNIQAIGTIHVPNADKGDSWFRWYAREHRKDLLKESLNKILEISDRPPKVVLRSLDPDLSQSLDVIFRKLADLTMQTRRVIYDVEEATRQQQSTTREWEEQVGAAIEKGVAALQSEIASLAKILKELTLKAQARTLVKKDKSGQD